MKNKGFAPVLLVLLIALGIGLFFAGTYFANNNQSQPQASQSPSPLVINNYEEPVVANWTTYSNAEFSFKYPKEGTKTDTGAAGAGYESIRVSYMGEKQRASGRTETSLSDGYMFVVTNYKDAKSTQSYVEDARKNSLENCLSDGAEVSNIKTVTVNGKNGYQYTTKNCFGDHTFTYIEANGNTYHIVQSYLGEQPEYADYKKTTDQIISTLKFK